MDDPSSCNHELRLMGIRGDDEDDLEEERVQVFGITSSPPHFDGSQPETEPDVDGTGGRDGDGGTGAPSGTDSSATNKRPRSSKVGPTCRVLPPPPADAAPAIAAPATAAASTPRLLRSTSATFPVAPSRFFPISPPSPELPIAPAPCAHPPLPLPLLRSPLAAATLAAAPRRRRRWVRAAEVHLVHPSSVEIRRRSPIPVVRW
ncbi:hypothetical protein [Oryza sativa Japonica Group]|uniref:Uncharacterized protein n=1 Tax=Oryza sativa subsp. japonica TaxID=39947 RepID=Q5ZDF6_ORYSJ|nr:hypothetical protein [Oryza sativa Japonica Group]